MFWKRSSTNFYQEQEQLQESKQVNLQFVDDTWERLLNAMERLEQRTEKFTKASASRMDRHKDRDNISENELEIRAEVHLQLKCLQRVVHPVPEESRWLIEDFLTWFGGRKGRPFAPADEYAIPTLQCILGQEFHLPRLDYRVVITEKDVLKATQELSVGLHQTDNIIEIFADDPHKKATQHRHRRGALEDGLRRMEQLQHQWAIFFVQRVRDGTLFKSERAEKSGSTGTGVSQPRLSSTNHESAHYNQGLLEKEVASIEDQLVLLTDDAIDIRKQEQARRMLIDSSTMVTVEALEVVLLNNPNTHLRQLAGEILDSLTQTGRDVQIRKAAKVVLDKA